MVGDINLVLILIAGLVASASPGAATLAIVGTSMKLGRKSGITLALGIITGSLIWSLSAVLGLAAIMRANAWLFEIMRYLGALYLLYLAYKSAKSAWLSNESEIEIKGVENSRLYWRGLLIHITNPKPVLFFGSLYSLGVPVTASASDLALVLVSMFALGFIVFVGYAILFSSKIMVSYYLKMKRWFEAAFAVGLGFAGVKILTARLD